MKLCHEILLEFYRGNRRNKRSFRSRQCIEQEVKAQACFQVPSIGNFGKPVHRNACREVSVVIRTGGFIIGRSSGRILYFDACTFAATDVIESQSPIQPVEEVCPDSLYRSFITPFFVPCSQQFRRFQAVMRRPDFNKSTRSPDRINRCRNRPAVGIRTGIFGYLWVGKRVIRPDRDLDSVLCQLAVIPCSTEKIFPAVSAKIPRLRERRSGQHHTNHSKGKSHNRIFL